ncbi:MAG: PAS domain S-box protein [Gammaproteobacteria bacterium]|nr:PAS domain S-box protein [Gammaproteobacteria bacterium]
MAEKLNNQAPTNADSKGSMYEQMSREHLIQEVQSLRRIAADTERRLTEANKDLREGRGHYYEFMGNSAAHIWDEDWSEVRVELGRMTCRGIANFRQYFDTHRDELAKLYSLIRINTMSRGLVKLYGAPSMDSLIAKRADRATREKFDVFLGAALSFMAGERRFEYEFKEMKYDGSPIVTFSQLTRLTNHINDWSRVIISTTEVTELKQAEDASSRTSHLLQNVLNTSKDFIFMKDTQLRTILCNDAFALSVGKKPDEMYGRTDIENGWSTELIQGNPEKGIHGFEQDDRLALSGKSVHNPADRINVGDEIRIFDTKREPLRDAMGNITGVLGIARDVTETRRTEKALSSFFDQTMNLHLIAQLDGMIHQVNKGWNTHLGYAKKELEGRVFLDLVHPDDVASTVAEISKLAQGKTTFYFENRYRHKNGTYRLLAWSAVASTQDQLIYAVASDITDHKKAEAEQARLQRELQQVQKMEAIGQLTSGIAHDFNNILGIMLGFTELAQNRCIRDSRMELIKYLNHVEKAGLRAKNLVAQMRAYTCCESQDKKPIHLPLQVRNSLGMLRAVLPSSIEIKTEIDEHVPNVFMDTLQIDQLLMNLLINSRDAMDNTGNVNIHLNWWEVETECAVCHKQIEGQWVVLSVLDTASGIKQQILDNIFDPFFTTKHIGTGSGMGLSVVNGIMHSHGGHVIVETQLDKGSTFRLLFPPAPEQNTAAQAADLTSIEWPRGHGEQILVVDDEPELSEVISGMLESQGYRTRVISSSEAALELFECNPEAFDLIITDQTMPKITGVELVKALRKARPDIPVILNTGFSSAIDKETATRMDVRYLEKPVNAEILLRTVGELLEFSIKQ